MNVYRGATAVEVIAIRLDPGDDVTDCLPRVARELQLAAGAIISGAGTLSRFALESPATETFPPAVNVIEKQGPGQIVAAQGIIASDIVTVTLTVSRRGEIFCGQAMQGSLALHSAEFVLLRAGGTRSAAAHPSHRRSLHPGGAAIDLGVEILPPTNGNSIRKRAPNIATELSLHNPP